MLEVGKRYRFIYYDTWVKIIKSRSIDGILIFTDGAYYWLSDGRRAPSGFLDLYSPDHRDTDLLVEMPTITEEELNALL